MPNAEIWPSLSFTEWRETCATLHMWTQIIGKIRLAQAPLINHWWQVPLYVTSRGLTTSPIPYGERAFEIGFDFIDHRLTIATGDGAAEAIALRPQSVADFYGEVMQRLHALGLDIRIWTTPVEIADPVPFEQDRTHAAYDPDYANRFWRVLLQADRVFTAFRARFIGKVSPVHFFWGSFDLAVTRFSGPARPAASRGAQRRRQGHPRSLFARGQQLRLLAGRPRNGAADILLLCLPAAGRVCRSASSARARPLTTAISANSSCLMMRSVRLRHPTTRYSIFCRALTKPRPPWPNGTAPNWSELRQREPVRPAPRCDCSGSGRCSAPPPRCSHRADRLLGPNQPARLLVRPGRRRVGAVAVRRRAVPF